jgi:hypothetical protein
MIDHNSYDEVERFAQGLKECFNNYRKNHADPYAEIVLDYVNKVIDLHLELRGLEFDRFINNLAAYEGEK